MSDPRIKDLWHVDFTARCFVNGTVKNDVTGKYEPVSGQWSSAFRGHPWVERSIAEDWSRDLRQHVIAVVKRRIMAGEPYNQIDQLMPDAQWIDNAREQAAKYAAAAKWREQVLVEHGSIDAYLQKAAKGNNRKSSSSWKRLGEAI